MALTPQQMLQKRMDNIGPRTGKSWSEWVEVAREGGIDTHRVLTNHLLTLAAENGQC
jgi:hypothetical protein